jgi:hypothetical protein
MIVGTSTAIASTGDPSVYSGIVVVVAGTDVGTDVGAVEVVLGAGDVVELDGGTVTPTGTSAAPPSAHAPITRVAERTIAMAVGRCTPER